MSRLFSSIDSLNKSYYLDKLSMGSNNTTTRRSQTDIQLFLDKEREKFLEKYENPIRQNAQLDDFELVRTVGTGSFGN